MRDLMLHHHVVEVSMESTLRLHVFPKVYRANDVCN